MNPSDRIALLVIVLSVVWGGVYVAHLALRPFGLPPGPCRAAVLMVPFEASRAATCPRADHDPEPIALPEDARALAYLCRCPGEVEL